MGLLTSTSSTLRVVLPMFFTLWVSAGTILDIPVFNSLLIFLPSFSVNSEVPPEITYKARSGCECMADDWPGLYVASKILMPILSFITLYRLGATFDASIEASEEVVPMG